MRRALSAAALALGLAASIATSEVMTPPTSAEDTVEEIVLDTESPDLELLLSISTRGPIRPEQVDYINVQPLLENFGPTAVRIEVYELSSPFEGEGVPEDAILIGGTTVRGAVGDEPGTVTGAIDGGISDPGKEVRLLLHLVDEGEVVGDLEIRVYGPGQDEEGEASISLEVSP